MLTDQQGASASSESELAAPDSTAAAAAASGAVDNAMTGVDMATGGVVAKDVAGTAPAATAPSAAGAEGTKDRATGLAAPEAAPAPGGPDAGMSRDQHGYPASSSSAAAGGDRGGGADLDMKGGRSSSAMSASKPADVTAAAAMADPGMARVTSPSMQPKAYR